LQFRVAERSESSLPQEQRQSAQAARRALRDHFMNVIQRGIRKGVFVPVDADVAAFSLIGMCNWCAWWFDSRRGEPIEPVAELIASFGLRMLGADEAASKGGKPSGVEIKHALARMHEALASLESELNSKR